MTKANEELEAKADEVFGPAVLVWRDDPLFNQGHVAAELALAALQDFDALYPGLSDQTDAPHAIERLEAFLEAARVEAAERASK